MTGPSAPRELVLASAGSGKTFRISSRLIGLLAIGVPPDQILGLSFARKAAGQILDRVLERMAAAALDPVEAERLGQHATIDPARPAPSHPDGWVAVLARTVRELHRLNIRTLDAFMVGAAGGFATELGLPTGWRIVGEAERTRLVSRALARMFASTGREQLLTLLTDSARGAPGTSVHDHLVGRINRWLEIDESLDPGAEDPWGAFRRLGSVAFPPEADRSTLSAQLREVADRPELKVGRTLLKAMLKLASLVDQRSWGEILKETLVINCQEPEPRYARSLLPPEVVDVVLQTTRMAVPACRAVLASSVEATGALTRLFRNELRQLQRETGGFDFSDITRLLGSGEGAPLGAREDLYYRLDGRIRHILLDEFQDTSLLQWEALEPLLDEVLSDDGRAAVIVADPKQSIYGWRGAEPAIVHAVGERYSLENNHLSESYRSSQPVLDLVNAVFEKIADNPRLNPGTHPAGQRVAGEWVRDFHLHRAKLSLPGYAALECGPDEDGAKRGTARPKLLQYAAGRIARLREVAPGFSIGVLTRTNQSVARIYLELRKLGIPVSQRGGNPLTDSAVCEAVLALFRVIDHPGDTISAYLVAKSPLGGVVSYRGLGRKLEAFAAYEDVRERERLSAAWRERLADEGYGEVLAKLARSLAPFCDPREARRLGQLVELAYQYDSSPTLRPGDFVRFVESTRVEDPASAEVKVMTVHQAKGLEFDIVVLPELGRAIGGRPVSQLPCRSFTPEDGSPDLEVGRPEMVMPGVAAELRTVFPELEAAWQQHQVTEWRDALSGLYVALTRARYATFAIISPSDTASERQLSGASLITGALEVELPPDTLPATVLWETGAPRWYEDPRAKPEWKQSAVTATALPVRLQPDAAGRVRRRLSPSDPNQRERVDIRSLLRLDTAAAMERGTVIHAWFEQLRWLEDGVPDDRQLREIAQRVVSGISPGQLDAALEQFRSWLKDGPIADALRRSRYLRGGAVELTVETEMPFVVRRDGGLMQGIIDRLVLIREG
ncbi:MAG: UvrD-helicase domain-containing protein, partial [Gemmatimonadota bacterium]|nr:UvrD-helicase domain-containing protein [Gemmatimonadota bacterium]